MLNEYAQLSRETRIAMVGHYLSKMVTLMVAAEKEAARVGPPERTTEAMKKADLDDSLSERIVNYLKRVHYAGPRDIIRYLETRRSTCFRRLKELRERNIIETRGHGRGVQYRLATNDGSTETWAI